VLKNLQSVVKAFVLMLSRLEELSFTLMQTHDIALPWAVLWGQYLKIVVIRQEERVRRLIDGLAGQQPVVSLPHNALS
jgi:hypothetical protein